MTSQTGVMAKKLKKGGAKGIRLWGGGRGGGSSWRDAEVLRGGPHKNTWSLSSPKLELWPKNFEKTQKREGKGGTKGVRGGAGVAGSSWRDVEVLRGCPRKNARSLSSPKLELWPKNCEKITIFKRLCDIWFGKFFVRQYRNIREVARVIHMKTPGLC